MAARWPDPLRHGRSQAVLLVTSLLLGCGAEDEASTAGPDAGAAAGSGGREGGGGEPVVDGGNGGMATAGGPTFADDIAPFVGAHCSACHLEGGAAPFALQTYEQVKSMGAASLAALEAGRMPPWQADPECRHYERERLVAPADVARFAAWVAAEMPEGRAGVRAEPPTPAVNLAAPDLVTRAESPYVPDPARPDDYRCFPLDARFEADTYVVGNDVWPGEKAIVHHVLVYVVSPDQVAELEAADAAEEGVGYTCYGGPGVGNAGPMAAWVPGYQPNLLAPDHAQIVPAGARLVMQVHYNTLATAPLPDQTEVHLWTRPEVPGFEIVTRPLAHLDIEIPAGEAESVQTREFRNPTADTWEIVATGPHMHKLGKRIKVERLDGEGAPDACLVDIPAWDFNWQQSYRFRDGESVTVPPGGRLRLTCVYDNSAANQPVINGEQLSPRDVTWGEGTLDEMCLNYITMRRAYVPGTSAGQCAGYDMCRAACANPDAFECALNCGQADLGCAQCVLPNVFGEGGCARTTCLAPLAAAGECLRGCLGAVASGEGVVDCMTTTCPENYAALAACMDMAISDGACDDGLAECGIAR
ncbi:hypothetical protein L6V77_05160 [Myxococcota bacterium]|nr:hypothetical protein [Myxococcota bacterium]